MLSKVKKFLRTKIGYFLKWQVLRLLEMDTELAPIKEALDRARTCTECFEANKCIYCGCPFDGLVITKKPCKRFKTYASN